MIPELARESQRRLHTQSAYTYFRFGLFSGYKCSCSEHDTLFEKIIILSILPLSHKRHDTCNRKSSSYNGDLRCRTMLRIPSLMIYCNPYFDMKIFCFEQINSTPFILEVNCPKYLKPFVRVVTSIGTSKHYVNNIK